MSDSTNFYLEYRIVERFTKKKNRKNKKKNIRDKYKPENKVINRIK